MRSKLQLALALTLTLACAPLAVHAQRDARHGNAQQAAPGERGRQPNKQGKDSGRGQQQRRGQQFNPGGPGRAQASPFERLRMMTPDEQRRALDSPMFRRMPPERQQQIRENLRRWNAMTPEQKQDMIDRERVWNEMSPEQQQRVRQEILPRWQSMEPRRRQALVRRLGVLRPLSEDEREAKLKDEAFLAGLTDEEREILRTVAKLRLPARPEDPPTPPPTDPPGDFPPL